jgi:hypothetical protein
MLSADRSTGQIFTAMVSEDILDGLFAIRWASTLLICVQIVLVSRSTLINHFLESS